MYSDLDTDTLVKNLCSGQQARIDKQEQKKTTLEWRNEAIQSVIDSVREFSNTYCSALGDSSMLKSSTYLAYSVTSDSDSKAAVLTASSSALTGDITLKINQLAKNSEVSSSGRISADGVEISSKNTATLAELSFANKLEFDSNDQISFSINGKVFTFSSDTTLQTMINTINNDADANVTIKYSRLTDSFTITADSGGADSSVTIVNISGNAFGENSAFQIAEGTYKNGQNAMVEINGVPVERNSNNFSIDGINYELKKVTAGTDEEEIGFTVSRDFSSTVEAVKKFVEALNGLITKLNELVSAKDYSSEYPPLTEAQKEEMTEKQIEAWEKKSKSGILSKDRNIASLISSLKNAFFSAAGGTGKTAASIGISTGNYFSTDKGKLVLDTDALTAALEKNPDEVLAIFTGGSSSASSEQQGVIYKIRNAMSNYLDTASESISSNEDSIGGMEKQIEKLKVKLDALADKYYRKFAAMETALSTLNSQSYYLSQLFMN